MSKQKLRATVSLIIAGIPAIAAGQQALGNQKKERFALEEIVVTAERRALGLQETPSSVVAISEKDLKGKSIDTLQDLQNFVPNLSIGGTVPTGQANPDFSIRGISSAHGRIGAEKGVALYIDDLYYPRAVGSLLRLADVERVEVLRGPQGTLFGRNATGGAVRYITRKPSDDFEARISATVGTGNRYDMVGLVNVPFGDKAALRAQVGSWDQDGYIEVLDRNGNRIHDTGEVDDTAARAILRLTPIDGLTVDIGISHVESKGLAPTSIISRFSAEGLATGDTMPTTVGGGSVQLSGYQAFLSQHNIPLATAGDARQISASDNTRLFNCYLDLGTPIEGDYLSPEDYCRLNNSLENTIASLDVTYDISDKLTLRYIGGVMDGDTFSSDALFGNIFSRFTTTELESESHELQLTFTGDRISGAVGYYYFNETPVEHTGQREFTAFGPNAGNAISASEDFNALETTTHAVFGQLNIDFTDRFSAILGIRYSKDDKESILGDFDVGTGGLVARNPNEPLEDGGIDFDGDGAIDAYKNTATFDSFDWRVTGRYLFNTDIMAYGTVSTGFKAGGFAADLVFFVPNIPDCGPANPGACVATDGPVQEYDSEDVLNYEIGVKADWLDGKLRTNISAFLMDYENLIIQEANFNKPTPGRPELVMLNAGDVDISGIEADISMLVTPELTLNMAVGYTNLDWQFLDNASGLYDVESCPDVDFADLNVDNCGLLDKKQTPKFSYSLGAHYSRPVLGGSELNIQINYGWTDDTETNDGDNSFTAKAYGLTSLRVQLDTPEHWSVALFGSNIFDEEYILSGIRQNGGGPGFTDTFVPGRGAEWGLTVDYQF